MLRATVCLTSSISGLSFDAFSFMKTVFNGIYFSGTSSKSYDCTIELERFYFIIKLTEENPGEPGKEIHWDIKKISKDDLEINGSIWLKYGSFPHQSIEVRDKEFPDAIKRTYPYSSFSRRGILSKASKSASIVAIILAGIIGAGVLLFKVILPAIAVYAASKVPDNVENHIGESVYNQMTTLTAENEEESRLVEEFFQEMNIERSYDYKITVLESETVNAFAVPGGRIAVYEGILDAMDGPGELAALLAHESSHVELRHSLKSIFRSLSGYFIVSLLFGDTGAISMIILENFNQFQNLQYSRTMEKEADMRGLECLENAGIDPKGMTDLFHTLEGEETEGLEDSRLFEFLSTHPLTKHRLEYINKHIESSPREYLNNPRLDSIWAEITKIRSNQE